MATATAPPSLNPDAALDLHSIAKIYKGGVPALRGIDLTVPRGSVFGLLGPNGAGKSTLVKILLTVIKPTQAAGHMLGHRIGNRDALRKVGYLPEHHRFPEYLTARQVVDHTACMTGVSPSDRRRLAPQLLELVGLGDWQNAKVGGFSKGMKQRVGIAQSLINQPDLILLDEPTDGVDPVGRREIRDIIHRLREEGRTVFLNSHLLSELEMLCDQVAILVQGKVAKQGTIDELTRDQREYQIIIAPETTSPAPSDNNTLPSRLAAILPTFIPDPQQQPQAGTPDAITGKLGERHIKAKIEGTTISVATEDPAIVQPLIDALRRQGFTIRSLRPMRPSLEDLFFTTVTDPGTGIALPPGAIRNQH